MICNFGNPGKEEGGRNEGRDRREAGREEREEREEREGKEGKVEKDRDADKKTMREKRVQRKLGTGEGMRRRKE